MLVLAINRRKKSTWFASTAAPHLNLLTTTVTDAHTEKSQTKLASVFCDVRAKKMLVVLVEENNDVLKVVVSLTKKK